MGSIALRDVGFLATRPLFQGLNIIIGEADSIGLVAGNGAGKSTLLKCLAGLMEPTTGEITRSRGLRVGLVEQEVAANLLDLPFAEAVRRAIPPLERDAQAWRVDMVLDEFAASTQMRDQPIRALSGGWQRLALIARAWVCDPDALLLDEPTNHLDLEKIQLLEDWLKSAARQIPLVVASHDRQFLDACTTRTLFLRPDLSRLYAHPYTRARSLLAEDDAAQAARLAKDTSEAGRLRRSANALRNIGINSHSDAALKKSMQMVRRAEGLEQQLRPVHADKPGDIRLANRGTHARVLIALADLTVHAPDHRTLFRVEKLDVFQQDRIVLLGRNGVGKSQFVALLSRALTERETVPGVRISATVVPGYVDQQMSQLPGKETPLGLISGRFRLGDQRSVSLLAGAGFPADMQRQVIARLSSGQKARLGLLALRLAEPNLYLMDEPTNHVDIAGQEKLEAEILAHRATCILVSHDRSFVKAIGTRFLLIEGGKLQEIEAPALFHRVLTADGSR
ncbi:ATP-binding cassette domain-containing protein [Limobrevibacterium gyesilva]|uniref:ATP-binding cassette domain-containing protein n=1 Tax=Limobrevibacterium gyesilva TaxID=2991712 RepID=A0AA41YHL8_9PROT|nr:ABC-F family ATP-binding cassette domain-containing protein [Limobrevibacterium gyesilva]MCW3473519.1 ATP-binding cassette domain-containing protein [Limobrevibacterium gyesilva]